MSELDDATERFSEGTETYDDRCVILGTLRLAQRERDDAQRPTLVDLLELSRVDL